MNFQDAPRMTSPTYPAPVLCKGQKQALFQGSSLLREKPDEGSLRQTGTGRMKPRRNSAKHTALKYLRT